MQDIAFDVDDPFLDMGDVPSFLDDILLHPNFLNAEQVCDCLLCVLRQASSNGLVFGTHSPLYLWCNRRPAFLGQYRRLGRPQGQELMVSTQWLEGLKFQM